MGGTIADFPPGIRSKEGNAEKGVSGFDRRVYAAFGNHCFGEPECWPSQQTIADELGVSRLRVTRAVARLTEAGWMGVVRRPWGRRFYDGRRWRHNVYEMLESFYVSDEVRKRIIKRAHRRQRRLAAGAEYRRKERLFQRIGRSVNTKRWVAVSPCECSACRRSEIDGNAPWDREIWIERVRYRLRERTEERQRERWQRLGAAERNGLSLGKLRASDGY